MQDIDTMSTMNSTDFRNSVVALWKERQAALGLKGKKADVAFLDFLSGAAAAWIIMHRDSPIVAGPLDWLIFQASVRGTLALAALDKAG